MKTVFITGADRGVGQALTTRFLRAGWQVFAGQYMPEWPELDKLNQEYPELLTLVPLDVGSSDSADLAARTVSMYTERLDMLVNCAGISNGKPSASQACLNVNALGSIRMVEAFLPLLERGDKRLCFVSSEAGCISLAHREGQFPYGVSKTCLNMTVKLMFNELRPKGYTFRIYHPGWVRSYMTGKKSTVGLYEPEEAAESAFNIFTSPSVHEDALMMQDIKGEYWPF